jgi:hypothetical protein
MKAVFVESTDFTEWIAEFLSDDLYSAIQQQLMANPDAGDVMPGCGGLRKLRTSDPARAKGKRGGARIVYLYVAEVRRFYMLDIYGKDEKDDLSAAQKKVLARIATDLKHAAMASQRTRRSP